LPYPFPNFCSKSFSHMPAFGLAPLIYRRFTSPGTQKLEADSDPLVRTAKHNRSLNARQVFRFVVASKTKKTDGKHSEYGGYRYANDDDQKSSSLSAGRIDSR
jgi:hypothetical protein